ncbi:MAG: hypothetical protein GWM90_05285, partial [Gemmatimonadetes bacterium]|nr:hypothetical protein [Gemmatimonadota bacterium]NIQ53151.1 hypothetical protein [Gemmatimonadota bacterium]NIU73295.1 hypothetical protein [Gammaproteobacteria bacterium]NIX43553.1 hypothetical protein [Gemmatimonadota bacterium]NIY07734.1 hypothetical protein [Gemmatimonadota bacterium]
IGPRWPGRPGPDSGTRRLGAARAPTFALSLVLAVPAPLGGAADRAMAGPGSGSAPSGQRPTWDFETGTLQGWEQTGTAFRFQPTLGDNPTARDRRQPSG